MRKRYKAGLIIISILLLFFVVLGALKIFISKEDKPKNTSNVVSNISSYGYTLDDRDTKYMKDVFLKLKEVLDAREVDEKEYASCIAKLFISDFYTLNNKVNKYDVGSLEYILSSKKEDFKNKAMSEIYKDIIDNTYKDRIQTLPEITNVEIISNEQTNFQIGETNYDAYKITMKYTYKKDLNYDNEGTLYLVKNKNKLEVGYYTPKIEE